jgi:hypothetical protein
MRLADKNPGKVMGLALLLLLAWTAIPGGSGGAAAWAPFFIPQVGAGDRWNWRGARIAINYSRVAGRRPQDPW